MYRLYQAQQVFRVSRYQQFLIKQNIAINKRKIQEDPRIGDDTIKDHNKILFFVYIKHALRTVKLILKILNLSMFVAIVFYVFCKQVYTVIMAHA